MEDSKKITKNILIVSGRSLTHHGTQVCLYNIINQSPPQYSFTWYCPGKKDKTFAEDIQGKGVTVVTGGLDLFNCTRRKIYSTVVRDIWSICHKHQYDIIHINTGSETFQVVALLTAAICSVPNRIAHSHSCFPYEDATILKRIKHYSLQKIVPPLSTRLASCSSEAAEPLFGKSKGKYALIVPNAINIGAYSFSCGNRKTWRKKLGVEDSIVLGHVGAFSYQKNQHFLIDIFKNIEKKFNNRIKLLLVGSGVLKEEIQRQIDQYGLRDKITITGYTNSVSNYLCAMDIFVFPSKQEGFGNACLEAQASGLPCVVSNRIPLETQVTDDYVFLPLEAGAEFWADKIMSMNLKSDQEREAACEKIKGSIYDMSGLSKYIDQLYG